MSLSIDAPELTSLLAGADHVDVKTVVAETSLREFVCSALSWQPGWMRMLFQARAVLARLFGLRHLSGPVGPPLMPDEIPFAPGGKIAFFTVTGGAEGRYLILEASDTHLSGYLAIIAEPLAASVPGVRPVVNARNRFRVVTIVRYHRWTGPVYFTIIRPFHHLVVRSMVNAGARRGTSPVER